MREPLLPMTIPALAAHVANVELMYSDNKYYELCGQMGHLIGPSGIGKDQLHDLVEAMMRSFRDHDNAEYKKLEEWARQKTTKGSNKDKPERPEVAIWFPPIDVTSAAFLALRATAEGVTGNPLIRANLTFSSVPEVARSFYKRDMINGFFGRIPFSYKARGERKGKIPRKGDFDDDFLARLDAYLVRLDNCKGRFVVRPLNKVADQLAEEMALLADLADDDILFELSHRSIFSAWKKAATLWILNDQAWTRSIWFGYYDLWSKVRVFGDMFKLGDAPADEVQKSGQKNMLDDLTDSFNELQLEALRLSLGKSKEGTRHQLNVWKNRGFISYSNLTGLYTKTQAYLKGKSEK